jgi:hypothetical protein
LPSPRWGRACYGGAPGWSRQSPNPNPNPSPNFNLVEVDKAAVDAPPEADVGHDHVVLRHGRGPEHRVDVGHHVAVEVQAEHVEPRVQQPRRHVPAQREERCAVHGPVETPPRPAWMVGDGGRPAARRWRLVQRTPRLAQRLAVLFRLRGDQVVAVPLLVQAEDKVEAPGCHGRCQYQQDHLSIKRARCNRRSQHAIRAEVAAGKWLDGGERAVGHGRQLVRLGCSRGCFGDVLQPRAWAGAAVPGAEAPREIYRLIKVDRSGAGDRRAMAQDCALREYCTPGRVLLS